jgi:hemerythrin-like domain-containing protein
MCCNSNAKQGLSMNTITSYLGSDHKRCDDLFADTETCVADQRWPDAENLLKGFNDALEHHFSMEEKVLFLAFEQAIGSSEGPTAVMRMEHKQIRAILAMLHEALGERNADAFFGCSETLNTMLQQHNMKEESILYLMSDRMLSGRQDEIIGAMRDIDATA